MNRLPSAIADALTDRFGAIKAVAGVSGGMVNSAALPLDEGYESRRPLLQPYPLLVHLRHFGEEYGPAIDSVLERYGA